MCVVLELCVGHCNCFRRARTPTPSLPQDRMDDVHVHPMSSSSQRMFPVDINKSRSIYIRRATPSGLLFSRAVGGAKGAKTISQSARYESVYLAEMIGRHCKFWLSMVWRNRVALLSGLSVAMLLLLLRRRCQRLTSCGATGRVGHLKRAIPCYRVSTCG